MKITNYLTIGYCLLCCLLAQGQVVNMPLTNTSITQKSCEGILQDRIGNYFNNVDGVLTIAPENSTHVLLIFKEFKLENGFDFLYIYDGDSIQEEKLIGAFTGTDLVNGDSILSTEKALTLHFVTDVSVTDIGFKACWSPGFANEIPTAQFTVSDALLPAYLPISFTDNSTFASTWFWDFGDGMTSTLQHPTHSYAASGTYPVSLMVSNCYGHIDTITKEVMIQDIASATISPLTFSTTLVHGETISFPLEIANNGLGDLVIHVDSLLANNELISWLSITENELIIPPMESETIAILFDATQVFGGLFTTDLVLKTNDPNQLQINIPCSLTVTGEAAINLSTNNIDFGIIPANATVNQTFIIENTGTDSLFVDNINTNDPNFSVDITAINLYGNTSQIITVSFSPTSIGNYQTNLSLTTNINTPPLTINLTGQAIGSPTIDINPTDLNLSLEAGEMMETNLSITNSGNDDLAFAIDTSRFTETISMLVYNKGIENRPGFITTLTILRDSIPNSELTTTQATTPEDLAAALQGKTVFVIPEIEVPEIAELFADFGSVLQTYVANGGNVIVLGTSGEEPPALTTGLFLGEEPLPAFIPVSNVNPTHPIVTNIPTSFTPNGGIFPLYLKEADEDNINVATQIGTPEQSILSIISYKEINQGKAVYIGFDYQEGGQYINQILKNTVTWMGKETLNEWLQIPVNESIVSFPNGEFILPITIDATNLLAGIYQDTLLITTNDPTQPIVNIPVYLAITGNPLATVSQTIVDFGYGIVGATEIQSITLYNEGTDTLFIDNLINDQPNFTISQTNITLLPTDSIEITITFLPTDFLTYTDQLLLQGGDTNLTIDLLGIGIEQPFLYVEHDNLTLSLVQGANENYTIQLANEGGGFLEYTLLGTLPTWLSLSRETGAIASEQALDIQATINTSELVAGGYDFDLKFLTNDPDNFLLTIPISLTVVEIPITNFEVDNELSCDVLVAFTDVSSNEPTSWQWNFGDGQVSTIQNPLHTYETEGIYTVELTTCNEAGCKEAIKVDYVTVDFSSAFCDTTSTSFATTKTYTACQGVLTDNGGATNYFENSNDTLILAPTDAIEVSLLFKEFNLEPCCDYVQIYNGTDLTPANFLGRFAGTNQLPNVDGIVTASSGAMTIILHSDESVGFSGFVANWQCTKVTTAPTASFTATSEVSCQGLIEFTEESVNFPNSWTWDFGDGNTSSLQNPSHNYSQNGSYTVNLTACNEFGCTEASQEIILENILAVDVLIPDTVLINTPFQLVDQTVGATNWTWDFGNGNGNVGLSNPITFYTDTGQYVISLTVEEETGCEQMITQNLQVTLPPINDTVGIDKVDFSHLINLYPNPSKDWVMLDCTNLPTAHLTIRVYDITGKLVLYEKDNVGNAYVKKLDFSKKEAGLYLIELITDTSMTTLSVVIQ